MHDLIRVKFFALLLATSLFKFSVYADTDNEVFPVPSAEIRWTTYGVPHIKAKDELGLGYGIGYAYAKDNACLMAEEVLTARGERALFFGRDGRSSSEVDNLTSDIFFTWFNSDAAVKKFYVAQPKPVQQLLSGYVKGFNRYLTVADEKALSCWGSPWLRPLVKEDVVRMLRRLLIEGGMGQFPKAVVSATPPSGVVDWFMNKFASNDDSKQPVQLAQASWEGALKFGFGSNGVAVGKDSSANGSGMLLANPHFPWQGALRMYQMHLTIPGKLDVMGASLPGFPLVNIGFNQNLAWTHTVDTSWHFNLFRLELDPDDTTRYLFDGESYPMQETPVEVQVLEEDGQLSVVKHTIYESRFGPVIEWPGFLPWTDQEVFALKDANVENDRILKQWLAVNQAENVDELQSSIERIQGIPWVNTLAADNQGGAVYLNYSVVPNLTPQQLLECVVHELMAEGLPGVEGNQSYCDWTEDNSAAQNGIVPASQLPSLHRSDFVQNSNDSAWMTNPDAPLEGFSPFVSREAMPLKLRTRFALNRLLEKETISGDFLKDMVTDNRAYLADLILDDVLTVCEKITTNESAKRSCKALYEWDRTANLDTSIGLVYFENVMERLRPEDSIWREPFDIKAPLKTPSGLAINDPQVVDIVKEALQESYDSVSEWEVEPGSKWRDIQGYQYGNTWSPISGSLGELGVYNVIEGDLNNGKIEVNRGSSYIQMVTFEEDGPNARGLLTFSQSSEPLSPHYGDQAILFAEKIWPLIPFSEKQIMDDPNLESLMLIGKE